jgi:glycosyltransferase involved in cell wall biosynthesis
LVHVLRNIDRSEYSIHFALHSSSRSALEADVEALGAHIHRLPSPSPSTWRTYKKDFAKLADECRPSVVHSHIHLFSGRVLQLAQRAGIPGRIAHGHNDLSTTKQGLYRSGYAHTMRRLIRSNATAGLACSPETAANVFGKEWRKDSRWSVLPCGIDVARFRREIRSKDLSFRPSLRKVLGIPPDTAVIGHVGRFVTQKNHGFLIEIAQEVIKRAPNTIFLLVGWGPLQKQIEAEVKERGLLDRCRVLGERSDVPELMLDVFDAMVVPSLYEGGPITLFEAQAAGIPSVVSNAVSQSQAVVPGLVRFLPLTESASVWADALLPTLARDPRSASDPLAAIEGTPADIRFGVKRLQHVYQQSVFVGARA